MSFQEVFQQISNFTFFDSPNPSSCLIPFELFFMIIGAIFSILLIASVLHDHTLNKKDI